MGDGRTTLREVREQVRAFVRERDWEQFHNVKELAAAIAIEAGELQEPLLWMTAAEADQALQHPATRRQVEEELADILILCCSLANRLECDLSEIVSAKLAANSLKYPAPLVRGSARKYTHYQRAEDAE